MRFPLQRTYFFGSNDERALLSASDGFDVFLASQSMVLGGSVRARGLFQGKSIVERKAKGLSGEMEWASGDSAVADDSKGNETEGPSALLRLFTIFVFFASVQLCNAERLRASKRSVSC